MRQYDLDTAEIDEKIKRVEKVESSFYVTAGYIIELTKNSSKLFEVSKEEERRLLIKTVLLNIRWNGEKLLYEYNSPFDLIVQLNEGTTWGALVDIIVNLEEGVIRKLELIFNVFESFFSNYNRISC